MATKIGDWYFEVTADSSPAMRALDAIALAAKGAAAIIAKELVEAGVEFNMSVQRSTALFTGLTGSMELARDTMREFAAISLDNPIFNTEGLARASQLLLTFGIAQEAVGELAQNINLTAIALGKGTQGITQLSRAIGQIQGRGWLEGDEARQLSEVGINAYAVIAEAIGKTTGEVMELGRQNLLLAEDVIPILNDHLNKTFGQLGPQLLNTMGVQVSGLSNLFTALGSAIVEPFIGTFGGGALVGAIGGIRESLRGLIVEGEDGLFELGGALAPLSPLLQDLADWVGQVADRFVGWLENVATTGDLTGFVDFIRVAVSELSSLGGGSIDLFGDLAGDIGVLLPSVMDFLGVAYSLGREALPILADGIRALGDILAILGPQAITAGTALLSVFGPTLLAILEGLAASLELLAAGLSQVDKVAPALAITVGLLTTALIAMNTQVAISAGARGLQALALGFSGLGVQATAARITLAGMSPALAGMAASIAAVLPQLAFLAAAGLALSAAWKGVKGDMSLATKDLDLEDLLDPRTLLQNIPAAAGVTIGSLFGGPSIDDLRELEDAERDLALAQATLNEIMADAHAEAARLFPSLLQGADNIEQFTAGLEAAGLRGAVFDQMIVLYNEHLADQTAIDAAIGGMESYNASLSSTVQTLEEFVAAIEPFADRDIWQVITPEGIIDVPAIEDAADFIKVLETVADDAAEALERLFMADSGATIDDFLRELPDLATAVTDALAEAPGVLRDLNVSGALNDAKVAALDVINTLSSEYGMSLQEIEDMFNERGLAGVIEALGQVTEETVRTIDPLLVKYGDLGVTVDVIRDAIRRLNDQRTTALRAQIDQVEAALRDAQNAAEDARRAFDEFFLAGTGGLQGSIDELVLDIPKIGDQIEEGLLLGGAQGEAMVRQAFNQIGTNLGSIFQLGLEHGLSPDEIIAMLAPVYGSIQQEVGGALNRISSLDWTEGFTPKAASEIEQWLAGVLDPALIGDLFSNITGADAAVSGIQSQLEDLNAQLSVDVEFSAEQVQAAIQEISTEIITEPIITPEAANAVWEEIQKVFDDEDLRAAVDQMQITKDIVDAAKDAEKQIVLEFNSSLVFDPDALATMALLVGEEFAALFQQQMINTLRGDWNVSDVPVQQQPSVQDFLDRAAELGIITPEAAASVTINNDITIDGAQSPITTATEVIAASSAAAGSGGKYDPAKFNSIKVPV